MKTIDLDIKSLNLEPIAYKIVVDEGWSIEKVDRVEQEYRAYLQVIRDVDRADSVAPTRDVDVFWHYHILDTMKYSTDCDVLFGYFIHHYPYSGIFDYEDAKAQRERGERTRRMTQLYLTSD